MFTVDKIIENKHSYIELKNNSGTTQARISLHEGGRLQRLEFNSIAMIQEESTLKYEDTYASSILFPFASRIKNGLYSFEGKEYQLNCNEKGKENALHGLVYNKKFELVAFESSANSSSVTLLYQEKEKSIGFPFHYNIYLKYTLNDNEFCLSVKIKNTDIKSFPFTLGWHPYFISSDLQNSFLNFKSNQKVQFDENLITIGFIESKLKTPYQIKDNQFDDSYILNHNIIGFTTPEYNIELETNTKENYLQIYTPKNRKTIAIEPMTGVCDNFNNKKGLQTLHADEEYEVKWNVTFSKNKKEK